MRALAQIIRSNEEAVRVMREMAEKAAVKPHAVYVPRAQEGRLALLNELPSVPAKSLILP